MVLIILCAVSDRRFILVCKHYKCIYIHTTHALSQKGYQRHLRYSSETPTFYQNYLAVSNAIDRTGGKPIAIWSQSISGVSAINLSRPQLKINLNPFLPIRHHYFVYKFGLNLCLSDIRYGRRYKINMWIDNGIR
jgi:hypothetical protein